MRKFRAIKDTRKFGGLTFRIYGSWYSKEQANKEAEKLRQKGYKVRITPTTTGYGYLTWKRK